jgi:ribosomal protein S17
LTTNIRLGLKCPLVVNTLTYNTVVSITAVKRLVIQVREKILSPLYEKVERK